jgi:hypothetical protein
MPTGYTSQAVNGQLVTVAPAAAYDPIIFGAVYTGSAWPRQGVYNVPPVTPSPEMQAAGTSTSGSGYPPTPTAGSASGNPYHLTKSPVIWVIVFLAFSLFMLTKVHWS